VSMGYCTRFVVKEASGTALEESEGRNRGNSNGGTVWAGVFPQRWAEKRYQGVREPSTEKRTRAGSWKEGPSLSEFGATKVKKTLSGNGGRKTTRKG